jgi:hypothetical protein
MRYAPELRLFVFALFVPALCYLGILLFGWMARRPHRALVEIPADVTT